MCGDACDRKKKSTKKPVYKTPAGSVQEVRRLLKNMRVRRHCSDERADTPDIKKKVEQQYQLRNQIDELEQKLLNSPELKSLRKREASLLNEIDAYRDSTIPVINAQIDKAQAKLALHGLTPTVIAMVEDLLQKYPELL